MTRITLAGVLALSTLAGHCMAGTFALTDKGCRVLNWNAQRVNPSYMWSGQCLEGFAAGSGTLVSFVDGRMFSTTEGTMSQGSFNGFATIRWADGTRYDGQVTNGSITGKGAIKRPDGTVTSGVFENSALVSTALAEKPTSQTSDSSATTALNMLGALSSGVGQGYASSDPARSAQLLALGNALNQTGVASANGSGATSSATGISSALESGKSNVSAEVASIDISGGCEAAKQKGEAYIKRIEQSLSSQSPSICMSAQQMRKLGEITVRVAEQCKNTPNWQALRGEGEGLIRESEETMRGEIGRAHV